jgi:hypothetical protein
LDSTSTIHTSAEEDTMSKETVYVNVNPNASKYKEKKEAHAQGTGADNNNKVGDSPAPVTAPTDITMTAAATTRRIWTISVLPLLLFQRQTTVCLS